MKVENLKRFSIKMLRCEARAFTVGTAIYISRPFFTPRKTRMRMNQITELWTLDFGLLIRG